MIARSRSRGRPSAAAAAIAAPPPEEPSNSRVAARLVPLDPGFYAFRLEQATGWERAGLGFAVPVIQLSKPPGGVPEVDIPELDIKDASGTPAAWIGGARRLL